MTTEPENQKRTQKKTTNSHSSAGEAAKSLSKRRINFDRFGWDVLGILLLTISFILLLGLFGLSQGRFVAFLTEWLLLWFGWGSYLLAGVLIFLGVIVLRKRSEAFTGLSIGKIISFEAAFFLTVSFLSVFGGHSLERAESGMDGGQIGWGFVELIRQVLPVPIVGIFTGTAALILFAYVFGIFEWIFKAVDRWAEHVRAEPTLSLGEVIKQQAWSPEEVSHPVNNQDVDFQGEAREEDAPFIRYGKDRSDYLPPLEILKDDQVSQLSEENIHVTARRIEETLAEFSIPARVVGFRVGPTVTQFAVEPGYVERPNPEGEMVRHKVRVSQISALSKDLALALSAERLRIEAPVPGQSFVGIEVPNPKSNAVGLRSILESEEFNELNKPLAIALGKDVSGRPVVADLASMPHLLIAGTTGSGKSVCIAALAACLAMNNTPDQLKLVMIDPKMVEMVRFNGIKHLLGKVETDMERIPTVLRWALAEMDRRYRLLEAAHARNVDAYNVQRKRMGQDALPKIVIMIDELADLMFSAPDQTEHGLVRLAQMARATGIHLVVATQRPSTDVVTGLIKANFPARISFNVASSIDSRVILDGTGAETLLGKGDMLFLHPEHGKPIRAQGVIISDEEIERLIRFWQEDEAEKQHTPPWEQLVEEDQEEGPDRLIEEAIEIVKSTGRASASMLQRRLRVGYPRAARLIDELEELGVVGPSQGGGREREVLLDTLEGFDDDADENLSEDVQEID